MRDLDERGLNAAAKVLYETWGGPWERATEFRKQQAKAEAMKVIEAYKKSVGEKENERLAIHHVAR